MTRRRVKDRLRKKQWARGLHARLYDVAIKSLCVNDAAVRHREDERNSLHVDPLLATNVGVVEIESFRMLAIPGQSCRYCFFQSVQTSRGREARNCAGAAQAWMRRQILQCRTRHRKEWIFLSL